MLWYVSQPGSATRSDWIRASPTASGTRVHATVPGPGPVMDSAMTLSVRETTSLRRHAPASSAQRTVTSPVAKSSVRT